MTTEICVLQATNCAKYQQTDSIAATGPASASTAKLI